jgi:hypothetical protein
MKPFSMSFATPKPEEKQPLMKPFSMSFGPPKPAVKIQQDEEMKEEKPLPAMGAPISSGLSKPFFCSFAKPAASQ